MVHGMLMDLFGSKYIARICPIFEVNIIDSDYPRRIMETDRGGK